MSVLPNNKNGSLRSRIIIFCTSLLLVVQALAFFIVNQNIHQQVETAAREKLSSGALVFEKLLELRAGELLNSSRVLSADFGFRSAVVSNDPQTIGSVLKNHTQRIGADMMSLVDLDYRVIASTQTQVQSPLSADLAAGIRDAEQQGFASVRVKLGGNVVQANILPVFTPDLSGWLIIGFNIDKAFIQSIKSLIDLDISILQRDAGAPRVFASTLGPQTVQAMFAEDPYGAGRPPYDGEGDIHQHHDYYGLSMALIGNGDKATVVLHKSNQEIIETIAGLNRLLLALGLVSVVFSVVGIALIANTLTRPLRMLSQVAERIRDGDYSAAANIAERDEIGLLAQSFNMMQGSIATLLRLAYRDPLTGLPNRSKFNENIRQAVEWSRSNNEKFTLLFLDLNRFKPINDTYGHEAGDVVLKSVAGTLRQCLRKTDTVARLGGDEFAVILLTSDAEDIMRVSDKIHQLIETRPIDIGTCKINIGCSIGAAIYPDHGDTIKDLMHAADQAMYRVKGLKHQGIFVDGLLYAEM